MPTLDAVRQVASRLRITSVRDAAAPPLSVISFIVRVVLGVFLLAAAGLKVHGLALDPLASESLLLSPRLQIATIEVEILLSLWLLSGWSVRAAFVAASVFFGILGGVSLFLALAGQRSCGCFGRVAVSPWVTFLLDIAAIGALALGLWRTAGTDDAPYAEWLRPLLKTGAVAAALLVVTCTTFLLAFDDPGKTLAWLRGESITVEPNVSDVGDGRVREERLLRVLLTNRTDRPIRIIGGTSHCACFAAESLPITLSEGETQGIDVRVRFVGSDGRFQHRFVLLTDDERQPEVVAQFRGRVVMPQE